MSDRKSGQDIIPDMGSIDKFFASYEAQGYYAFITLRENLRSVLGEFECLLKESDKPRELISNLEMRLFGIIEKIRYCMSSILRYWYKKTPENYMEKCINEQKLMTKINDEVVRLYDDIIMKAA